MGLREELLAEGCIEKRKGTKGTVYYQNIMGDIVAKVCTGCGNLKIISRYGTRERGLGGKRPNCRECVNKKQKNRRKKDSYVLWNQEYYNKNRERILTRARCYYDKNRERVKGTSKAWQKENSDMVRLIAQRRRANKQSLPNDLTYEQQSEIMAHFNNACALTGETTDLHLDHVIPLAAGHGGTTYGNMIPLRGDLNCSKNDSNLFEWFESNRRRFELSQERFDALVKYLADVNEMTIEEYKTYYNDCFEDKSKEETA